MNIEITNLRATITTTPRHYVTEMGAPKTTFEITDKAGTKASVELSGELAITAAAALNINHKVLIIFGTQVAANTDARFINTYKILVESIAVVL